MASLRFSRRDTNYRVLPSDAPFIDHTPKQSNLRDGATKKTADIAFATSAVLKVA